MDCFDTCQATLINAKVKGSKEHKVTNGKLCVNFAYLLKEEKLEQAFFENEEISLEKSLNILTTKLKNTKSSSVLYYKGSGNLGVMQNAPKVFLQLTAMLHLLKVLYAKVQVREELRKEEDLIQIHLYKIF